jgi:hypothetical protein
MKRFGIVVLSAGVILMGIAAFKFIKERNQGSEEQMQNKPLPFPWMPTTGALLTAAGIIMMGTGRKTIS